MFFLHVSYQNLTLLYSIRQLFTKKSHVIKLNKSLYSTLRSPVRSEYQIARIGWLRLIKSQDLELKGQRFSGSKNRKFSLSVLHDTVCMT